MTSSISFNPNDYDIFDEQVSGNNSSVVLRLNDVDAQTVVLDMDGNQLAAGFADLAFVNITNGNLGASTRGQFTLANITEGSPHLTGEIESIILSINDTDTGIQIASLENYLAHGLGGGSEQDDVSSIFSHRTLDNDVASINSTFSDTLIFSSANAVPTPSSTILLFAGGIAWLACRQRSPT